MIKKLKKMDPKKAVKILKISIALNVILASLLFGAIALNPHHNIHHFKPQKHLVSKQIMKQHRKEIRIAKKEFITALMQEPFNKEKTTIALQKVNKAMDNIRNTINTAIIEKASQVNPQERFEWLPHPLKLKKHKGMLPPPPPPALEH